MICKRCKSENVIKSGKTKTRAQIYKCKECGFNFTYKTRIRKKKLGVTCIRCGSENVGKNGRNNEGKQRYICKDCGLVSIMDKDHTSIFNEIDIPEGLTCPTCNGINLVKSGCMAETGKQKYKCKDCGRKFVEGTKIKERRIMTPFTVEEKRVAVFYHMNFGVRIKDIAEHLKKPASTVSVFLNKYKKRMKEKQDVQV